MVTGVIYRHAGRQQVMSTCISSILPLNMFLMKKLVYYKIEEVNSCPLQQLYVVSPWPPVNVLPTSYCVCFVPVWHSLIKKIYTSLKPEGQMCKLWSGMNKCFLLSCTFPLQITVCVSACVFSIRGVVMTSTQWVRSSKWSLGNAMHAHLVNKTQGKWSVQSNWFAHFAVALSSFQREWWAECQDVTDWPLRGGV